jgi:DNA-binding response OmpR family regulator
MILGEKHNREGLGEEMVPTKILIADDDPSIVDMLKPDMEAEGWQAYFTSNGDETIKFVHRNDPDLVILDIGMPGTDGIEVCRHITAISNIPVIMLTARSDEETRVKCLGLGAAGYVTKPFRIARIIDKVKEVLTMLRVNDPRLRRVIISGDVEIDVPAESVKRFGHNVKLKHVEFILLSELALNADNPVSSKYLLRRVWGVDFDERSHVHATVDRLRAKLEIDAEDPKLIVTVPGFGYVFNSRIKAKS